MKNGDLIAIQKACDELIESSLRLYRESKTSSRCFRFNPRQVLGRERLSKAALGFVQGYLEFMNLSPIFIDLTKSFAVTVDVFTCTLNPSQAKLFTEMST